MFQDVNKLFISENSYLNTPYLL